MSTKHNPIKSDLVLNRVQAKSLVCEIASMCEKAYRLAPIRQSPSESLNPMQHGIAITAQSQKMGVSVSIVGRTLCLKKTSSLRTERRVLQDDMRAFAKGLLQTY